MIDGVPKDKVDMTSYENYVKQFLEIRKGSEYDG